MEQIQDKIREKRNQLYWIWCISYSSTGKTVSLLKFILKTKALQSKNEKRKTKHTTEIPNGSFIENMKMCTTLSACAINYATTVTTFNLQSIY